MPADVRTTVRRLPRLLFGLVVFGLGLAMTILGNNGLPPWDVFHDGLQQRTALSFGGAVIVVGVALLLVMVAMREPIGVGTLANVVVIGLAIDVALWAFEEPSSRVVAAVLTLAGPVVVAIGSGFYLGVDLGAGPRDGIMTGLVRRGVPVWSARLGIEATVFVAGVALGGSIGWGTVWFLVVIGPLVEFFLGRLSMVPIPAPPPPSTQI